MSNLKAKRWLVLPLAGLVIAGLCYYKIAKSRNMPDVVHLPPPIWHPAPVFSLYNEKKNLHLVRLATYLGRHNILIAFFDGKAGADKSELLKLLSDRHDQLRAADVYTFAISTALPQENRKAIEQGSPFPFSLLSDPTFEVHQQWGRWDVSREEPTQGLFFLNRAGMVAWNKTVPSPVEDVEPFLDQLIE